MRHEPRRESAPELAGGRGANEQCNTSRNPLAVRPKDAARLLGVSERTLWRWTDEGRIRCLRVGGERGAKLYRVSDLEAFLESLARGGGS